MALKISVPTASLAVIIAHCVGLNPANAESFSDLYGYWQGTHTPCNQISDDGWTITSKGASAFESSCSVLSAERNGNRYSLKQECEGFENEVFRATHTFTLISPTTLEIEGSRYARCSTR